MSAPAAPPHGGQTVARREHLRGLLLCIVGVVVISPDALIVRSVGVGTWTTIFWRGAFTAVGTLALLAVLRRRTVAPPAASPRSWRPSPHLGAGALFAAASVAFISALFRTDAASVLVMIAAGPLIASVLARIFFHERTPARTWVAGAAVLAGLAVIVGSGLGRGKGAGDLLALAGATCFAGYLTVSRAARPADMTPSIAIGGVGAAVVGLVAGADLTIGAGDLLLLLLLGGVILPVSLTLITLATRSLPAPEVNLIALLETVLGPVWVWLVLGERPAAAVLAGGLIVVAAVTVHSALALRAVGSNEDLRSRATR